MGRLSTHVLDTAIGRPAGGVKIELLRLVGEGWSPLKTVLSNIDGRTEKPLLEGTEFTRGHYKLEFHIGDYFRKSGATLPETLFFDVVPIQIGIADASAHYHVPLLCTPWSYSTYRGS